MSTGMVDWGSETSVGRHQGTTQGWWPLHGTEQQGGRYIGQLSVCDAGQLSLCGLGSREDKS